MVITMSGIKEALQLGDAEPSRLVGMMTTGFALGQIAGPVTVALVPQSSQALTVPSLMAVAVLIVGNCVVAADFGAGFRGPAIQRAAGDR
jgi:uncharacterized MFS-type transporter YbfB